MLCDGYGAASTGKAMPDIIDQNSTILIDDIRHAVLVNPRAAIINPP
jgi:hypothetical protein